MPDLLAAVPSLKGDLRRHPRVAHQGILDDEAARTRLVEAIPPIVPFRKSYKGALLVVDWDHRLPSRNLTLRILCYYDERTLGAGAAAFGERLAEIAAQDRFPEFDVPDFGDVPSDEAYEVDLGAAYAPAQCRLTSTWRREIPRQDARNAVDIARESDEFKHLIATSPRRSPRLGDLEAVAWTPPCESGHATWTLDVWYLMAFDGVMGSGRSLLVDCDARRIVAVRDFAVRAG